MLETILRGGVDLEHGMHYERGCTATEYSITLEECSVVDSARSTDCDRSALHNSGLECTSTAVKSNHCFVGVDVDFVNSLVAPTCWTLLLGQARRAITRALLSFSELTPATIICTSHEVFENETLYVGIENPIKYG